MTCVIMTFNCTTCACVSVALFSGFYGGWEKTTWFPLFAMHAIACKCGHSTLFFIPSFVEVDEVRRDLKYGKARKCNHVHYCSLIVIDLLPVHYVICHPCSFSIIHVIVILVLVYFFLL